MAHQQKHRSAVLVGAQSLLVQCGIKLLARGWDLRAVASEDPAIRAWAEENGIRAVSPGPRLAEELSGEAFDYLLALGHLRRIPGEVLRLPRIGGVNFHDALLPNLAGLNTPVWALLGGAKRHGITWHWMTEDLDDGGILLQSAFDVDPGETALTLNTRCFETAIDSFDELAGLLENEPGAGAPQDLSQRVFRSRTDRPEAGGVLDLRGDAERAARIVRALDHGRYDNPLITPKLCHGSLAPIVVRAATAQVASDPVTDAPGTILAADGKGLRIATGHGVLVITDAADTAGRSLSPAAVLKHLGLAVGDRIESPDVAIRSRLTDLTATTAPHDGWWGRSLAAFTPVALPGLDLTAARSEFDDVPLAVAAHAEADIAAAFAVFLGRLGNQGSFDLGTTARTPLGEDLHGWAATTVPVHFELDLDANAQSVLGRASRALARTAARGTFLTDVVGRTQAISADVPGMIADTVAIIEDGATSSAPLALVTGDTPRLRFAPGALSRADAEALARRFEAFLLRLQAAGDTALASIPVLTDAERVQVLEEWNAGTAPLPEDLCVHEAFEQVVDRDPDAAALSFEGETLTYAELERRANRVAHHLRALGVGPDSLVGVHVDRSLDLVVAALGVLKSGGAYVPLDPGYPADRVRFMVTDSGAQVILSTSGNAGALPDGDAQIVRMDRDLTDLTLVETRPEGTATAANLAYAIYTSGSTGRPKGVLVEHRNVVSFFTGMDAVVPHEGRKVWLAVTSLSFDISVLELLWTLARGFEVVLHRDRAREGAPAPRVAPEVSARPMDFGLFYWGNDDGPGPQKYALLLEGAKFGDANGFSSVWTPERHFHAFGGPYPNPAVTGAAVAAVTERIGVRSGSCVIPLHHPIRVAEEWSVVDNLSGGRVGLSVASGWQPEDFVLRPEAFENNKEVMFEAIETVRSLWAGDEVAFPGPFGEPIPRRTLPRPVQDELPIWVTSAGNPETYRRAGEVGANVLTHLLGQSVEEVAEKIRIYREARAAAGHDPDTGIVSLMLHTYVSDDADSVRDLVRGPMKSYLGSSVHLVRKYAWTFPAFKRPGGDAHLADLDLDSLDDDEVDAILEHAFERYFRSSGLFGTPEDCMARVDELKAIGVDEIACLIDFGIAADTVLASLPHLATLRALANRPVEAPTADHSFAGLVERHGVTHMQCTPSMARMLLDHAPWREALGRVDHLFVGGEALPPELARDLETLGVSTVTNMYGPTETTIWSSTHRLAQTNGNVPIGRGIANTELYVLDERLEPVPPGVPGELFIGGPGVVRGYHERPELTAERFLPHPFRSGARVYRTGDLVRHGDGGRLEFLGRLDHQVKVRGHRIELGEIESCLVSHVTVRSCVVVAREDIPGDVRLVAYVIRADADPDGAALRIHAGERLPAFMVPARVVVLDRFPLTPNGKIDRNALPAPEQVATAAQQEFVAPEGTVEATIAATWRTVLDIEKVGVEDNFFDLGGHSLLVVEVHRRLRDVLDDPLSLTDLYRFPTIRSLAVFLSASDEPSQAVRASQSRAARRRAFLGRRRGGSK